MVISKLGNHLDLPDDIKTSDQAELYLFKADLRKIVEEMRLVAKVNSEKKPSTFDDVVQAKTREEEATFWADKLEKLRGEG